MNHASALLEVGPHIAGGLTLLVAVLASGHAVLWKRDPRSAIAWVGLIWLVPVVGAGLYVLLGVNRIRRHASTLDLEHGRFAQALLPANAPPGKASTLGLEDVPHLAPLVRLGDLVTRRPLMTGNKVQVLDGGAQAYPAMWEAIGSARQSVTLCTYIFDSGRVGDRFVRALSDAVRRGVQVRVLVDAVGVRYSRRAIHRVLRREGVRCALFLPSLAPAGLPFLNLRNHRKVMVVDGRVGFTGGMNLRDEFFGEPGVNDAPAQDLHFRLEGPVVHHLQEAFAEDWSFTTREDLTGEAFFPVLQPAGEVRARGVNDGPDDDLDAIRWAMLGALAVARRSVRVVTPYFLPDPGLVTALNVTALRGVEVDLILPERGNLKLVQWAMQAQLWQNLQRGCRVFLSPPPFDHSKLMVVDETWAFIGSANWDPRSLRLNFEFNVECYDKAFAAQCEAAALARRARSRPVTLEALNARPFPQKLRDGIARLFSPYL